MAKKESLTDKKLKSVRLTVGQLKKIESWASNENRSVTNYMETVLIRHIEERINAESTVHG